MERLAKNCRRIFQKIGNNEPLSERDRDQISDIDEAWLERHGKLQKYKDENMSESFDLAMYAWCLGSVVSGLSPQRNYSKTLTCNELENLQDVKALPEIDTQFEKMMLADVIACMYSLQAHWQQLDSLCVSEVQQSVAALIRRTGQLLLLDGKDPDMNYKDWVHPDGGINTWAIQKCEITFWCMCRSLGVERELCQQYVRCPYNSNDADDDTILNASHRKQYLTDRIQVLAKSNVNNDYREDFQKYHYKWFVGLCDRELLIQDRTVPEWETISNYEVMVRTRKPEFEKTVNTSKLSAEEIVAQGGYYGDAMLIILFAQLLTDLCSSRSSTDFTQHFICEHDLERRWPIVSGTWPIITRHFKRYFVIYRSKIELCPDMITAFLRWIDACACTPQSNDLELLFSEFGNGPSWDGRDRNRPLLDKREDSDLSSSDEESDYDYGTDSETGEPLICSRAYKRQRICDESE